MLAHENNNLLKTRKLTIYEEIESIRLDELSFSCLSIKFPIFDSKNEIIGVFGISVLTDRVFKEAESLAKLIRGLNDTDELSSLLKDIGFENIKLIKPFNHDEAPLKHDEIVMYECQK